MTTDEDDDDEYSVDHTNRNLNLMAPDGEFVDLFTSGVDSR